MPGIHFQTTDGIELIGLGETARTMLCADFALPGDYVVLAENRDPEASMRMLPFEQQMQVEFKTLRVSDVWLTVDELDPTAVWRFQYQFEGLPGTFRGGAFIDAGFDGYAYGALVPCHDKIWFVPAKHRSQRQPPTFGEPILVAGLGRSVRHHLIGTFQLRDGASSDLVDLQMVSDIKPVWGKATFGSYGDDTHVIEMNYWEACEPAVISEALDAVDLLANSLKFG